jgi:hemerythrin
MRIRFVTTLEKELVHWIKIQAAKEDKRINDLIEELISKYKEEKQENN